MGSPSQRRKLAWLGGAANNVTGPWQTLVAWRDLRFRDGAHHQLVDPGAARAAQGKSWCRSAFGATLHPGRPRLALRR